MSKINSILERAKQKEELSVGELVALLSITDADELQALYDCAYFLKEQYVGKIAYFRGIIECSNLCMKDCLIFLLSCSRAENSRWRLEVT